MGARQACRAAAPRELARARSVSARLAPEFRIGSRTVLVVLAFFLVSTVVSAIAPLVDRHHSPGQDVSIAVLADPAGTDRGGDSASCNHACHLLHHFQGSVERAATSILETWSGAYDASEPGSPPQLFFEARLRPPRVPARSV
jgi:hypothetical protein